MGVVAPHGEDRIPESECRKDPVLLLGTHTYEREVQCRDGTTRIELHSVHLPEALGYDQYEVLLSK
jgi:hypothetical protein